MSDFNDRIGYNPALDDDEETVAIINGREAKPFYVPPRDEVEKCSNCGAPLKPNFAFCVNCGTPVAKAEESEPIIEEAPVVDTTPRCANCGAELKEGFAFCVNCGMRVEAVAEKSEYFIDDLEETAVVNAASKVFCANCGAVLPAGTRFCTTCGSPDLVKPEGTPEAPVKTPAAKCCINCGTALRDEMKFCVNCGTPVSSDASAAVKIEPAVPSCPNCGNLVKAGIKFCTVCGTRLDSVYVSDEGIRSTMPPQVEQRNDVSPYFYSPGDI